ncbi:MAG TPA: 3-phosphoshikimate 1-carboxyvinyltransferase [Pyrinomonadaceae bacterium]|nr:3-phosphoshikimate 1-carboxyvinyltransferase [Pyrinomonadaceae bacterium]
MLIRPAKCLKGEVGLPGDKSISHRAAMMSALAEGETRIVNYATSVDCRSTLECLRQLGVEIEQAGSRVVVRGVGQAGFREATADLDCGNSGTTIRLIAGILSGQPFDTVLTGDASLRRRPMRRIIDPLQQMGAVVESNDGKAPLRIHGSGRLRGIDYELPVASAQIKSCVLLAGLNADGETTVIEPVETRDHTERMLKWFGVDVKRSGNRISVRGGSKLRPGDRDLQVPGDISASAFFMVAAACLSGSDVSMDTVGLNPTRSGIVDTLRRLGADIEISNAEEVNNEPVGRIRIAGKLRPAETNLVRGEVIANIIDEIPILAIFGTQIEGGLEVRDASELRVKETDRIAAVVENLRRMGAVVEEFDDGFRVERSALNGARIDSFDDHRIAMAFAVAGLMAESETKIEGAECAGVSFPEFFDVLKSVVIYE